MHRELGKSALIVIDMQQGMFAMPDAQPYDGTGVVLRIRSLIARARETSAPLFFVQHQGGPGHPLEPGSKGYPFVPDLSPLPNDCVVIKEFCSAFRETDLDDRLRSAGVEQLIFCGMQTEYCIDTAVRVGFELGYRITLVSDGHTTGNTRELKAEQIISHHNRVLNRQFAALKLADHVEFF